MLRFLPLFVSCPVAKHCFHQDLTVYNEHAFGVVAHSPDSSGAVWLCHLSSVLFCWHCQLSVAYKCYTIFFTVINCTLRLWERVFFHQLISRPITVSMSLVDLPSSSSDSVKNKASFSIDSLLHGKPADKVDHSSGVKDLLNANLSQISPPQTASAHSNDLVNDCKHQANPFFINFPINPHLLGIHQTSLMEPIYRTDVANTSQNLPNSSSPPTLPPSAMANPWAATWAVLHSSSAVRAATAALASGYLPGVLASAQQLDQHHTTDSWGKILSIQISIAVNS